MKKAVMCFVENHDEAAYVVGQLQAAGFANRDISVLFSDQQGSKDFAHEHNTKAPEGAMAGVGAGGVVGGALGLVAGLGALAIPGLGPFIAAGPLMAVLSGAAAGAALGGVTGALVGMGIPEVEAKRYEGKLRHGNILIAVSTDDAEQQKQVEHIFQERAGERRVRDPRGPCPEERARIVARALLTVRDPERAARHPRVVRRSHFVRQRRTRPY